MKLPGLFKNKILCYALVVLAVLNVIGYITAGAYECLAVFLLAYYGADQYCKNMSCSIIVGLFASNFLFGCGRVKETFVENLKRAGADPRRTAVEFYCCHKTIVAHIFYIRTVSEAMRGVFKM